MSSLSGQTSSAKIILYFYASMLEEAITSLCLDILVTLDRFVSNFDRGTIVRTTGVFLSSFTNLKLRRDLYFPELTLSGSLIITPPPLESWEHKYPSLETLSPFSKRKSINNFFGVSRRYFYSINLKKGT